MSKDKQSNKEYQLKKYEDNPKTIIHLLSLIDLLTNSSIMKETEGKITEYWNKKKYVGIKMPNEKKWAWIDTKKDNYYNFYMEETNIRDNIEVFENINISLDNILLDRKWTRIKIENTFNIFQEEFIELCCRRYHEYKKYKLDGNPDISNLT